MKLTLQLAPTATGQGTYLQIMSDDMVSLNIVLVVDEVEIRDDRPTPDPEQG